MPADHFHTVQSMSWCACELPYRRSQTASSAQAMALFVSTCCRLVVCPGFGCLVEGGAAAGDLVQDGFG